jgi:hypothetical protein
VEQSNQPRTSRYLPTICTTALATEPRSIFSCRLCPSTGSHIHPQHGVAKLPNHRESIPKTNVSGKQSWEEKEDEACRGPSSRNIITPYMLKVQPPLPRGEADRALSHERGSANTGNKFVVSSAYTDGIRTTVASRAAATRPTLCVSRPFLIDHLPGNCICSTLLCDSC